MNYDLTDKEWRRKFVKYANQLLKKQRTNVSLVDESMRTLNQNSYVHILCRIMALETGVSEDYAKQVYFKRMANNELFVRVTKDILTGKMIKVIRSSSELSVPEMTKAISNFIQWAAEQGYELPEAITNDDGTMTFKSDADRQSFHQAELATSAAEQYL